MHYLFGLVVLAVAAYVLHRAFISPPPVSQVTTGPRSERGFAFLSNGLLFHRERGDAVKQVHSPYAQEAADRRERSRDRHSWKEGTSFNIAAGGGRRSFDAADAPLVATSAAFEANGDLLYFLKDANIGGLFRREAASGKELRLLIKQNLHLTDLMPSPEGDMVAASSRQSGGTASIVLIKKDGSSYREVTGGDSMDTAPAWIPGAPDSLLFQSAGLARSEQGHVVAIGHASILKLDMSSGTVTPILEDARYDFLKPRVAPSGDLLFIRRPFEMSNYGAGSIFMDTLLFPFRLLRAVFHYLNFFSMMYTQKPLTSANGPAVQANLKDILLQGRRIDAEKALRSARPVQGVPSLVPDSWMLVSRNQRGEERVLATNVASFDIGADSTIIYSNGQGVFVLEGDGASRLAATNELVAEVIAATV